MSKILNWGECAIFTRKYADPSKGTRGTTWSKWDTPAEGTTTLETTEGDKTEAKVEGGENEAVRKGKNTYALNYAIRMGANHVDTIDDTDGVIEGEYEVIVAPMEDKDAPAMYIPKSSASCTDSYNSAEGTQKAYTFDALKNDVKVNSSASGTADKPVGQVVWGSVNLDGTSGLPTSFTAYKDAKTSKTNLIGSST